MELHTLFLKLKNTPTLLPLILVVFFLKGVFLVTLQPIFGGQDEARHYDTIQHLAQPQDVLSSIDQDWRPNDSGLRDKDNFDSYNFSQEIQKTAQATNTNILRGDMFNTLIFSDSSYGKNESEIDSKVWKPYNYYVHPDIAGTASSLYHKVTSHLEALLSEQTILTRFYLLRILSVTLGTLALYFCYLTARTSGFSFSISLIITALVSFQPKFSLYFTNINYDVFLIPMFFLFTFAGVHALKNGLSWKNIALFIVSIIIAVETKATGYILLIALTALLSYFLYTKIQFKSKRFRYEILGLCISLLLLLTSFLYNHFLITGLSFQKTLLSIHSYVSKTITFGKFIMPSDTYWGILGWTNSFWLGYTPWLILLVELMAIIGISLLFFSQKFSEHTPSFLPAKKYILFLTGMIVALQLGVRIVDWSVFSQLGGMTMSTGTPGRYFLPNLSAHILLMATGLGALLAYTKKERYFETILLGLLILMFSLMMYLTFNALILRFYF